MELETRNCSLESYFVEAGRRAHVVWRLDGSYGGLRDASTEIVNPPGGGSEGIWVEPLRVADGLDLAVWEPEAGLVRLERFATEYRREHGVSEISYRLPAAPGLAIAKQVWVPLDEPAVVVDLRLENAADRPVALELYGESRFRLGLGWPRGWSEAPVLAQIVEGGVVRAANRYGQAVLVADPPPSARWIGSGPPSHGEPRDPSRCWWRHEVRLGAREAARLRFVVAAISGDGPSAAEVAASVLARGDALLAERIEQRRRCFETAPRLTTPEPVLDQAFALARPALEDFKHVDPKIGLGYFAGFPAYNFYFAGDAFRMLYGACALGDWDDAKEILRTIIRGQRLEDEGDQLAGELWHELSTTGDAISPNFVTLELPSILLHYVRWSGDLDFLREAYPAAARAARWAARKDCDGDGLPDNGPEQTFADGVREDLNVAGAHLTPALWQMRAYFVLRGLAALVGQKGVSRTFLAGGERTRKIIRSLLWDARQGRFAETLRSDGVLDTGPDFAPSLEYWSRSDDPTAERHLDLELQAERHLEAAGAAGSPAFDERRQARAWYAVERGDRARRLFRVGRPEDGLRELLAVAELLFRWPQAGFFPEIASRATNVADLRGCFHQGWTAGFALAYPVVDGLWRLEVNALEHRFSVAPTPPPHWESMALEGLRVGSHTVCVRWRRRGDWQELVVENDGPPLNVEAALKVPDSPGRVRMWVDDRPVRRDVQPALVDRGYMPERARVRRGGRVVFAAVWSPEPVEVTTPTEFPALGPGEVHETHVEIANQAGRLFVGRLHITAPEIGHDVELRLGPGGRGKVTFPIHGPGVDHYRAVVVFRLLGEDGLLLLERSIPLLRLPALQIGLEGPGVAIAGRSARLRLRVANPGTRERRVGVRVRNLAARRARGLQSLALGPGSEEIVECSVPVGGGTVLRVAGQAITEGFDAERRLSIPVASPSRPLVLYTGFLGQPFGEPADLLVYHVPANYAVRRPDRLLDLLPDAAALVLTDQQDAVLSPELTSGIADYVERGGRLLFFSAWSAAWGRGFHHTYCSIARTELPALLPLHFLDGIETGGPPRLEGIGAELWTDLPWENAPPLDYNRADLADGASCWARAAEGTPLAATWMVGEGRVVAIGLDCFGFGHGTLVHWPGQAALLRRALDWLLK